MGRKRKHTGFYIRTEGGTTAHVLGDPDMPEETANALAAMIDCAVKWLSEREERKPADRPAPSPGA